MRYVCKLDKAVETSKGSTMLPNQGDRHCKHIKTTAVASKWNLAPDRDCCSTELLDHDQGHWHLAFLMLLGNGCKLQIKRIFNSEKSLCEVEGHHQIRKDGDLGLKRTE